MQSLTQVDVDTIIQYGRGIPDNQCTQLLDLFEKNQSQLYQAIYGEFSDAIAVVNRDMANLFLDLCFDILLVYTQTVGDIPHQLHDDNWLESKMALLSAELQSLSPEAPMNPKVKSSLNDRFVERCISSGTPFALLSYLDFQVHHYASFDPARCGAISLTNNLLFTVVRLIDSIFEK